GVLFRSELPEPALRFAFRLRIRRVPEPGSHRRSPKAAPQPGQQDQGRGKNGGIPRPQLLQPGFPEACRRISNRQTSGGQTMKQSGTVGVVAKAILLSCLVLVTTACTEQRSAGQTIRIGFSVASDDFLLERWSKDVKIFSSRAGELGAEVILARSAGDALSQIPQIQYLLGQDIDVLVVIPQDMELLNGVIKSAMDRGIPVLAYDRPIMGVSVTGYVSFDNHRVGEVLAESLVEA